MSSFMGFDFSGSWYPIHTVELCSLVINMRRLQMFLGIHLTGQFHFIFFPFLFEISY